MGSQKKVSPDLHAGIVKIQTRPKTVGRRHREEKKRRMGGSPYHEQKKNTEERDVSKLKPRVMKRRAKGLAKPLWGGEVGPDKEGTAPAENMVEQFSGRQGGKGTRAANFFQ